MASEERGLVSVVVPVYNGRAHLAETIESALAQEYEPFEVIVVDDGSDDESARIASSYASVHVLRQNHAGCAAARNRGVFEARGEFLAFLDADDLWPAGRLGALVEALRDQPEADLVFGKAIQFISPDALDNLRSRLVVDESPLAAPLATGMLARTVSFRRVGPFPEHWRLGEFLDWYGRAQDLGLKVAHIDEVVLKRRIHADNLGLREAGARADYARILKAMLDRRRAGG